MTAPPPRTRRWWRPPTLRTLGREGGEGGERHASWLELFFDLVLVVAIAQATHVFVHHPDAFGAAVAGGLFVAVFLAWQGFSFYADRFDTDDLIFRAAAFAQMFAMLALAGRMDAAVEGHPAGFAIAFAALRGILVLLYVRAWFGAPRARPLVQRYGGVYAISVGLWLASTLAPAPWWIVMWAVAILLDLSMPPLNTRLHRAIPTDVSHVPERFGLFTLIVLGEMVVSVSLGTGETAWRPDVIAVAAAGFCIAACLWWVYFERLTGQELREEARPIVTFAYAHLPLLGALLYVAGGVAVLVASKTPEAARAGAWALCGGVGVFLAALNVAHRQLVTPPNPQALNVRWVAAVAALVVPLLASSPLGVALATLAVMLSVVGYEAATCSAVPAHGEHAAQAGAERPH